MKRFAALLSVAALVFSFSGTPIAASAQSLTTLSNVKSGDLVRGETFAAVYYVGKDGFRYVFPNDKTYFTWYDNFDSVKWISDADLATIQIGGNVTYKPGAKMLKINSDPKTYAVDANGTLRWVTSESIAISLYGSNWNKQIDDVPDAFFGNYQIGDAIEDASAYSASVAMAEATNINDDKDLLAALVVEIQNNNYSPSPLTVPAGRAVKFINKDDSSHSATASDLSWGTGTLKSGEHFSRYFKFPGTYSYFDSYNNSVTGTLNVQ